MGAREVHGRVKPGEVVDTAHLLALVPAALQTQGLAAKRLEELLVRVELREVAVQGLAAAPAAVATSAETIVS